MCVCVLVFFLQLFKFKIIFNINLVQFTRSLLMIKILFQIFFHLQFLFVKIQIYQKSVFPIKTLLNLNSSSCFFVRISQIAYIWQMHTQTRIFFFFLAIEHVPPNTYETRASSKDPP